MCFKPFASGRLIYFLVGLLLFGGGCSLRGCPLQINETSPTTEVVDLGEGCLNGVSDTFDRYFDGKGSEEEVNRVFRCASRSLQLFAQRTRGAEEGRFTSQELKKFLEDNFVTRGSISSGLVSDAMALKQSFLGGDQNTLTREEIDKIRAFLEVLREQAVILLPYQPLTKKHVLTFDFSVFSQAVQSLVAAGKAIGGVIQEKGVIYTFEQLERFMFELERIYPDEKNPKYLRDKIPLLKTLKATLLGDPEDRFVNEDLSRLFHVAAGWYAVGFQGAYFQDRFYANPAYDRGRWLTGDSHRLFSQTGQLLLVLLEDAVSHHDGERISFEAIDRLIEDAIDENDLEGFLPKESFPVKKETLKKFIRPLFERILAPAVADRASRPQNNGLDLGVIRRLQTILSEWDQAQYWVETVFARLKGRQKEGTTRFSRSDILLEIESLLNPEGSQLVRNRLNPLFFDPEFEPAASTSRVFLNPPGGGMGLLDEKARLFLMELGYHFKSWPLFLNEESPFELTFLRRDVKEEYSLSNFSYMNLLIRIIHVLLESYGSDYLNYRALNGPQLLFADEGIKEEELAQFDGDIQDLLIKLRWMHPLRTGVYRARFMEGNVFTFASQSDEWLMAREGTQLVTFMISSKKVASRLHEKIGAECMKIGDVVMEPADPKKPQEDFFGGLQIRKECFWKEFRNGFDSLNTNVPMMVSHFQGLDAAGKSTFEMALKKVVAGSHTSSPDVVDSSDLESIVGVLQYIEALFRRHDTDGSGLLDKAEAHEAYKVFRYTIKKLAAPHGLTSDEDVFCLYLYLILYGETPSTWFWKNDPINGHIKNMPIKSGRNKILMVFQKLGG